MTNIEKLHIENERLQNWVNDLHSGMYINCVYCGHQYGPAEQTPVAMADVLKEHIERCPQHPMSALKTENKRLREALRNLILVCGNTLDDFEDQAEAFHYETGKMRPGKDQPMADPDIGATREEYRVWVNSKLDKAREAFKEPGDD